MHDPLELKSRAFLSVYSTSGNKDSVSPELTSTHRRAYFISKRIFDILLSLFLIPVLIAICLVLAALNPFGNPGPLFYLQKRVGKDGQEFSIVKFRSMSPAKHVSRRADDPLEKSRLTPLGKWIRNHKVDELPQIFNVLLGHMSLVGPRPEMSTFVPTYRASIDGYKLRETFRPGMTGYAQVTQGYTDSIDMVRVKTELDMFYIRNAGWRLDLHVIFATVGIVIAPPKAPMSTDRFARRGEMQTKEVESDGPDPIGGPCSLL